jgi:hypothetical protein
MPWSWSLLMAKGTGSYVRSSSEWWYPLGVHAIKCTVSCMYKSKRLAPLPLCIDNVDGGSIAMLEDVFLSESASRWGAAKQC